MGGLGIGIVAIQFTTRRDCVACGIDFFLDVQAVSMLATQDSSEPGRQLLSSSSFVALSRRGSRSILINVGAKMLMDSNFVSVCYGRIHADLAMILVAGTELCLSTSVGWKEEERTKYALSIVFWTLCCC